MRKIDHKGPLSQFGCVSDDRNVGPWERMDDNAWKAPAWRRMGPVGYRNMFNDEVAYATLAGFGAYGPDGLLEETGHVWGHRPNDELGQRCLDETKKQMDETLRSFGWIVDGQGYVRPTRWQRFRMWLGLRP